MADCAYTFPGPDGKPLTIVGVPGLKAYLVDGGLEHLFPERKFPLKAVARFSREGIGATINVDGVERPTTNSTGQLIHQTEDGIRNFWKWFGESKVVDSEGRPLVVYHGTTENFSTFGGGSTAYGIFFTPDYGTASFYGDGKNGRVVEVYLKADELADLDDADTFERVMREAVDYTENRGDHEARTFAERLYKDGYSKNEVVKNFFDSLSGFSPDIIDDGYSVSDYLQDERIGFSEIDELVRDIQSPKVSKAYDEYAPKRSEELEAAREAYGTQEFYMTYQDDFMRAAQAMGFTGV